MTLLPQPFVHPSATPRRSAPIAASGRGGERGAATLVVVLLLFFVVSLVAAYTSRNLIFEQRISVNQYRSTMAFEAADAGMEWALAMLNGGRIGDNCVETPTAPGNPSFRDRFLAIDAATGMVTPRPRSDGGELYASCVWDGTAWDCSCPTAGTPALEVPAVGDLHPAFALRFTTRAGDGASTLSKPGVIRIDVNGCVRMTANWADDGCRREFGNVAVDAEGRSQHTAVLALKGALTTLPTAAVTVVGSIAAGSTLRAENPSAAAGGVTVHAAGSVDPATLLLRSVPGTPGAQSVRHSDASLVPAGLTLAELALPPVTGAETIEQRRDRVFASFFGLLGDSYRDQPAALRLICPSGGCSAELAAMTAAHPGRVVWVDGDLTLQDAADIGTAADPAMVVVRGEVRVVPTTGVRIAGVVYLRNWEGGAPTPPVTPTAPSGADGWNGAGELRGALISESDLSTNATPTVVYDPAVLASLRRRSGSFVRLPGDWRDYKDTGSP